MKRAKENPAHSHLLAEELSEQGLSKKLSRYSSAKQHTRAVSDYIIEHEPTFLKYTDKLHDCGSWLVFRNYYTVNKNRLIKANLCKKHLLCGLCAMRRSALQVKSFEPKLAQVLAEDSHLVPLLITFTIKNGEDLEERFNHLDNAKKRLVKKRSNAINCNRNNTVLKYVQGAAGSYELKKGEGSGSWHPHIHMIALVDRRELDFVKLTRKKKSVLVPLDFENELRSEWLQETGDSHMVDVRMIQVENDKDKFGAICEAFKYALKLNDLEISDQVEAARILQGRRLQFSLGNLHGIKINENLVDDPEKDLELLPYIDMVYHHNQGSYHLQEMTDYGSLAEDTHGRETTKHRKPKANARWEEAVKEFHENRTPEEWKKIDDEIDDIMLDIAIKQECRQKSRPGQSALAGSETRTTENDGKNQPPPF